MASVPSYKLPVFAGGKRFIGIREIADGERPVAIINDDNGRIGALLRVERIVRKRCGDPVEAHVAMSDVPHRLLPRAPKPSPTGIGNLQGGDTEQVGPTWILHRIVCRCRAADCPRCQSRPGSRVVA